MNLQSLEQDIAHNRHSKTWQLNPTSHLELDALAYKGHYENKSQKKKKLIVRWGGGNKIIPGYTPNFLRLLKKFFALLKIKEIKL